MMDLRLSREDFDEWRNAPATVKIMSILERAAREAKHKWIAKAWDGGDLDPKALYEHRERAAAYQQLVEFDYNDFLAWAEEAGQDTGQWNK